MTATKEGTGERGVDGGGDTAQDERTEQGRATDRRTRRVKPGRVNKKRATPAQVDVAQTNGSGTAMVDRVGGDAEYPGA